MSDKHPGGRPSIYTPELADELCSRLCTRSLRSVCEDEDMPGRTTVFRWLRDPDRPQFRHQYARACDEREAHMFDEMEEIADDGTNDWMEKLDKDERPIGWVINGEHQARSRLRIDTRKWMLAKMNPKKYGEKVQIDGDLNHTVALTPGELSPALGFLAGNGPTGGEGSEAADS
jgi:hypothetical protein